MPSVIIGYFIERLLAMREFTLTNPANWPDSLTDIRKQMGEPLNVHRYLASYPGWLQRWWSFRNQVIHETSLSEQQYELIVLRVARVCDASYEWEHHVVTGRERGLADADFAAIEAGPSAAHWDEAKRCLLCAVDECIADHRIQPATLNTLTEHYSDQQVLDLIATVVIYQAMAIVTRSFEIPIDREKPSFSKETFERH